MTAVAPVLGGGGSRAAAERRRLESARGAIRRAHVPPDRHPRAVRGLVMPRGRGGRRLGGPRGWPSGSGPSGHVVATDLDPRFLRATSAGPTSTSAGTTSCADPLEEPGRSISSTAGPCSATSRTLAALRRMAAALRPGGWLLVEDADCVTLRAADPGDRRAAAWDRLAVGIVDHLAGRSFFNPYLGRHLLGLVASISLTDVAHEGSVRGFHPRRQPVRPVPRRLLRGASRVDRLVRLLPARGPGGIHRGVGGRVVPVRGRLGFAAWGRRPG